MLGFSANPTCNVESKAIFNYSASLNGLTTLPSFINFNNVSGTFTMNPSNDYSPGGIYHIVVTGSLPNQ